MPNTVYLLLDGKPFGQAESVIDRQLELLSADNKEQVMQMALGMLHRHAVGIVHVDTGRLKNSLFWDLPQRRQNTLTGRVATNVEYAPFEERRGGSHAFFERTIRDEGRAVNDLFATQLRVR